MKKYIYWNAIFSIPISAILIIRGAWVFINSTDKADADGYFIAGLLLGVFGIIWTLLYRRNRNRKVSSLFFFPHGKVVNF